MPPFSALLMVGGSMEKRSPTNKKFWRRSAASGSLLIFTLAPFSLATAQQIVVRDVCSRMAAHHAPIFVEAPSGSPSDDVAEPEANKSDLPGDGDGAQADKPEVATIEANADAAKPPSFAAAGRVLGCVLPSPIGVIYNPTITADIHRQYENSLAAANGVTKDAVVSNVTLEASIDVTTPPREQNDGSIVISLTGGITNQNPFPLSSVTIQCDYRDAHGKPKSSVKFYPYILGPRNGYVPYQDEVIDVLPPHSVVNGISCKVETADIWQSSDGIQYLNAPLNPSLELSPPAPSGSAQTNKGRR
jgi:hypothetical protein